MSAPPHRGSLQEALAVYAESIVSGARVALLGEASFDHGAQLVELGARSVRIWDPDAERARREAQRRSPASVGVHAYDQLGATEPGVDVVLVPDLGVFADPRQVVSTARRLAGDAGVVLLSARNKEAPPDEGAITFDYYELYDLVAAQFANVSMIAQWAFQGTAFAVLGDVEESVSVDTQLAGERAVERFLVLASEGEVLPEPYVLVELPQQARAPSAADRLLARQAARAEELEIALADSARREETLAVELQGLRTAVQLGREASVEIERATRRFEAAEQKVGRLEQELAAANADRAKDVSRLEDALRERAHAVRALEGDVANRERLVRELLDLSSEGTPVTPPTTAAEAVPSPAAEAGVSLEEHRNLRDRLDAMAIELAKRQAQSQATEWALAEAEARLRQLSGGSGAVAETAAVRPAAQP